jgi:uncharacterized protein YabE (DUF348 family)
MRVRPSRVRRLRVRRTFANVTLLGMALAIAGGFWLVQKTVTLVVEGQPEAVRTMSANVGELLQTEGIVLGWDDIVSPPSQTPLADGMRVLVDLDFENGIVVPAPSDVGVWVMEGVPRPPALLAARSTEDWFSTGEPVGQSEVVAARVVVMGKDHEVLTNAPTVGKLLSAMGIEPDRSDRVLPSLKTPLHSDLLVRFVEIDFRIRALEVPVPHTTYTEYSDELRPGRIQFVRSGVDGLMVERYRVKVVNGEVVARSLLGRQVVREAIAAKRIVGSDPSHGTQVGEASWYSFAPGDGLTAAHPWLPFGTVVTVTNLANGNHVQVVINDRGPFGGRIIDLSDEAFARIAPLSQGVCQVRLTW